MSTDIVPASTSTPSFVFPDRTKLANKAGNIFKLVIIGVIGFATYVYLLPFILIWARDTILLLVMLVVGGFLAMVVSRPAFWRGLSRLSNWLATKVLSLGINMDRWGAMYDVVDDQMKAIEEVGKQTQIINGQLISCNKQIQQNNQTMQLSHEKMEMLADDIKKAKSQAEQDELRLQYSDVEADFSNAKDFIDGIQPQANDLATMVGVYDKIYRQGTVMLKIVRKGIDSLKKKSEAADAMASAMNSAQRALSGRADLNADAAMAREMIEKDIANKLGIVAQGIKLTTQILNANDLNDAAKARLAVKTAQQFNIDAKFNYSDTLGTAGDIQLTDQQKKAIGGNQYLDFLK